MVQKEAIKAVEKARQSYLNRIAGRAIDSELHQEIMNAYNYALNLMKMVDANASESCD